MAQKNMRTRNLDPSKPMVIFDSTRDDLPEKMDQQGFIRTTNILPTGIEKEEETEHHLQLALSAVQSGVYSKEIQGIPVPKVEEITSSQHDTLYPTGYKKDKELYRVQGLSSGPEPDVVDYCIDEADEAWLKETGAQLGVSVDRFESAIDRLEKATGAQFMSESDAGKLLKDRSDIVSAIYTYWLAKRRRLNHALISRVRTETKRDSGSGHDPYVAFRRRAEKMQTRKNRKSDEQNYILMFKMRIAHTHLMRDGLMDILKGVRERETLKLRTSLMERHEFQLAKAFFDDPAGLYQSHLLDNYPELNRIEAETFDDMEYEDEMEANDAAAAAKEDADSLEEFSDVSDSGNESDSWSHIHHPDLKNRSPHFDMERDESASNFAASQQPADPNLVPESQYKGEDPPEYWGPDGEFTFVPRKDCKYFQPKEECDSDFDQPNTDAMKGFFLQEIPVVVGRMTVMKTVLCRRSYGRNGTKLLEYYKLPECLDTLDLALVYQESTPLGYCQDEVPEAWKNVLHENKEQVYVHAEEVIKREYPVEEEPVRWNLTEEDVEDLFQAALRWPLDTEGSGGAVIGGEEEEGYQIACTSVCQPLQEHSYCRQPVYGDLYWLDAQMSEGGDVEEGCGQTEGELGGGEAVMGGETVQGGTNSPASVLEGEFVMPATPGQIAPSSDSGGVVNGKRKPVTVKKAKGVKGAAGQEVVGVVPNGGGGVKRKAEVTLGTVALLNDPSVMAMSGGVVKKPPRKRTKGVNGVGEEFQQGQSENVGRTFDFQIPSVPPPLTGVGVGVAPAGGAVTPPGGVLGKKGPVKRKSPPKKTPLLQETIKVEPQNGDDSFPNKKPKRRAPAPKRGKDEVVVHLAPSALTMPQALQTTGVAPKSPLQSRPILPFGVQSPGGTPGGAPVAVAFSPSPTRTVTPLQNGAGPLQTRMGAPAYPAHPNLHSLLANGTGGGGGLTTNGYHAGVGGSTVGGVGSSLSLVVHTPKLLN